MFAAVIYTDLKTVVSIPSSGALERSDNPYIESIVESCVSKNQKEILARWVQFRKKF